MYYLNLHTCIPAFRFAPYEANNRYRPYGLLAQFAENYTG